MVVVWQLLLAVFACYGTWWLKNKGPKWRRMLKLAASIPGPPAWPVIGNALVFMARPEDLLNILEGYFDHYGQYVRLWMGPDLNICIKNPTDIRLILTSNKVNQKGPLYKFVKDFIGPGILAGGPSWRIHRKIATPSYSKKCVSYFSQIFNEHGRQLAETLSSKDPRETFDVYRDTVKVTTECVCQTLMGLSIDDSKTVKRMDEVVERTKDLYTHIFTKMTHWWLQIPFIYWLTGMKKTEENHIKLIDDVAADIVVKRRNALQKEMKRDEDTMMGVVDRLILSGELTEEEIVKETFTLFTTSQEASAKIAAGVLILAHLPEWQEKVYNEICDILGSQGKHVPEEHLKKLEALDMVYKETLRYLSIAAFIQRTVEEEINVKNGELTLPIGASVIIPIHMMHRDPNYWEDPHKVDPGRFRPENVKKRDPNAFVPFSLGAMDCLGRVYGTALIKTLVIHVLWKLELKADGKIEDLDLNVAISVRFANGFNVRIRPR